jgi:hypothetical protein
MIFKGSMSTASKSQGKKLERGISLAQCTKPERRMKWSETDILFRLEYQLETELSNRNLPFMVKLLIGCHKVAKTLIDNGASINLIMRKTFIEMDLNLSDLCTPIGHIKLEVSCRSRDNKRREIITFEVMSFNIGYNCILRRPFPLKFMVVIHITYATMKMLGPKGIITFKTNQ